MLMGVTVLLRSLVTYAMVPFGVTAMPTGRLPTGIGLPVVLVAMSIGVTVLPFTLVTYAVVPFGVMAMPTPRVGT
jgi:hypothetical protein